MSREDKRDAVVAGAKDLLDAIHHRLLNSESRNIREECDILQAALDSAPPEERGFTESLRDRVSTVEIQAKDHACVLESYERRISALEARAEEPEVKHPVVTIEVLKVAAQKHADRLSALESRLPPEPPAKEADSIDAAWRDVCSTQHSGCAVPHANYERFAKVLGEIDRAAEIRGMEKALTLICMDDVNSNRERVAAALSALRSGKETGAS